MAPLRQKEDITMGRREESVIAASAVIHHHRERIGLLETELARLRGELKEAEDHLGAMLAGEPLEQEFDVTQHRRGKA